MQSWINLIITSNIWSCPLTHISLCFTMDTVIGSYCAVWLEIMHMRQLHWAPAAWQTNNMLESEVTCSPSWWLLSRLTPLHWSQPVLPSVYCYATGLLPYKHGRSTTKEELEICLHEHMSKSSLTDLLARADTLNTPNNECSHITCTFFNVDMLTQSPRPHMHENTHVWTNLWLVVAYYFQLSEQETRNSCPVLTQWGGEGDMQLQIRLHLQWRDLD